MKKQTNEQVDEQKLENKKMTRKDLGTQTGTKSNKDFYPSKPTKEDKAMYTKGDAYTTPRKKQNTTLKSIKSKPGLLIGAGIVAVGAIATAIAVPLALQNNDNNTKFGPINKNEEAVIAQLGSDIQGADATDTAGLSVTNKEVKGDDYRITFGTPKPAADEAYDQGDAPISPFEEVRYTINIKTKELVSKETKSAGKDFVEVKDISSIKVAIDNAATVASLGIDKVKAGAKKAPIVDKTIGGTTTDPKVTQQPKAPGQTPEQIAAAKAADKEAQKELAESDLKLYALSYNAEINDLLPDEAVTVKEDPFDFVAEVAGKRVEPVLNPGLTRTYKATDQGNNEIDVTVTLTSKADPSQFASKTFTIKGFISDIDLATKIEEHIKGDASIAKVDATKKPEAADILKQEFELAASPVETIKLSNIVAHEDNGSITMDYEADLRHETHKGSLVIKGWKSTAKPEDIAKTEMDNLKAEIDALGSTVDTTLTGDLADSITNPTKLEELGIGNSIKVVLPNTLTLVWSPDLHSGTGVLEVTISNPNGKPNALAPITISIKGFKTIEDVHKEAIADLPAPAKIVASDKGASKTQFDAIATAIAEAKSKIEAADTIAKVDTAKTNGISSIEAANKVYEAAVKTEAKNVLDAAIDAEVAKLDGILIPGEPTKVNGVTAPTPAYTNAYTKPTTFATVDEVKAEETKKQGIADAAEAYVNAYAKAVSDKATADKAAADKALADAIKDAKKTITDLTGTIKDDPKAHDTTKFGAIKTAEDAAIVEIDKATSPDLAKSKGAAELGKVQKVIDAYNASTGTDAAATKLADALVKAKAAAVKDLTKGIDKDDADGDASKTEFEAIATAISAAKTNINGAADTAAVDAAKTAGDTAIGNANTAYTDAVKVVTDKAKADKVKLDAVKAEAKRIEALNATEIDAAPAEVTSNVKLTQKIADDLLGKDTLILDSTKFAYKYKVTATDITITVLDVKDSTIKQAAKKIALVIKTPTAPAVGTPDPDAKTSDEPYIATVDTIYL